MKNIRIIYTPARANDPMAVMPTVAVRAEIGGVDYGVFVELEKDDAEGVCRAVEMLLGILGEVEK